MTGLVFPAVQNTMSEICQLGDSHDAPDALTARSAITHCPLLPLELLGNIYELLLTPNARLTQNAQLKFTAVSRLWRRAAYRRDLFVTGPRLDALLECLELELPSWRYDAVSLRLVCGSLKPQALGRLLNFLPGLRHAFFDFHKLKPEHLSYIAAAPCGAHLVSLRLAVDQRPSQVTFDFEAAFPSLDSLSLDEEAPSYFTRNPFPPPQLSGLSLPVWRRSPSELKPILVTASALDDPLKKLTLPFGVWWSLTDSSNLDEYLTDALDGLERLSLTSTLRIPSYPDTEEELVQEDTTYVCRRFWPKALRSLNVSTMRLRHESSVLKVVLESITGSRRAAAKSPLHQIRPDKFMDLVFSSVRHFESPRGGDSRLGQLHTEALCVRSHFPI